MVTEADVSIAAMTWVFNHAPTKDATEQVVLLAIADYSDEHGCGAFPSLATLSRKTRLTRRSVIRVLDRLKARGVVVVAPGNGRRGSNHYTLPMLEHLPATSDPGSPVVVTDSHQGSDPGSPPVVTDGHQGSDPRSPDPFLIRQVDPPMNREREHALTRAQERTSTPAAFDGPIFRIPMQWAEQMIRGSNGGLSIGDIEHFGRDLTAQCERERRGVGHSNLLRWLDYEFGKWCDQRADAHASRRAGDRLRKYLESTKAAGAEAPGDSSALVAAFRAAREAS